MNDKNHTLLVTGATGKLGREVVDLLLNEHNIDPQRLILTSRKPDGLSDLSARGVKVRSADFEDADSLKEAFAGADALLLISIDAVGRRVELHSNAIAAAESAGVKHLVYTSMPAPETSPLVFAPEHKGTEARIASSTIPGWSVLRNNWYFENLLEFQASILSTGQWLTLTGDAAASHISRRDLGRAAAAALLNASAEKRTLTLNGPAALTVHAMAEKLGEALGKPINVTALDEPTFRQTLTQFGLPEFVVEMSATLELHNLKGLSAGGSGDFEALTGRMPETFAAWVDERGDALRAVANSA